MKRNQKLSLILVIIISTFLLTSCLTISGTIQSTINYKYKDVYTADKDILYGSSKLQNLDIYYPAVISENTLHLIVLIHGGSWISGDKNDMGYFAQWIMNNIDNTVVASINYRFLEKDTHFEEIFKDVDTAIKKVIEVSDKKGITFDKMAIGGTSSGGQMSLMYSYSNVYPNPIPLKFCLSMSSPSNLEDPNLVNSIINTTQPIKLFIFKMVEYLVDEDNIGDAMATLPKYSPVNYITENSVPTIIAHGKADNTIPYSSSVNLDKVLTESHVEHDFKLFEDANHHLKENPISYDWIKSEMIKFSMLYF